MPDGVRTVGPPSAEREAGRDHHVAVHAERVQQHPVWVVAAPRPLQRDAQYPRDSLSDTECDARTGIKLECVGQSIKFSDYLDATCTQPAQIGTGSFKNDGARHASFQHAGHAAAGA